MFKKAILHYPTNKMALMQIHKNIVAFHCAAAVKYMETLGLNDKQKAALIGSLLNESSANR